MTGLKAGAEAAIHSVQIIFEDFFTEAVILADVNTRLFKSFKFGNGSRMSDEKLVILEFKYLQNKKW